MMWGRLGGMRFAKAGRYYRKYHGANTYHGMDYIFKNLIYKVLERVIEGR